MQMFQILTLVESINTESRDIRSVYLGHIGEMHYVSTLQAEFTVRSYQTCTNNCCVNLAPYENDINNCNCKRKNSVYMKENGQKRKAEKGISNEERIINTWRVIEQRKKYPVLDFKVSWRSFSRAIVYLYLLWSAVLQT